MWLMGSILLLGILWVLGAYWYGWNLNPKLMDGSLNSQRGLLQFTNGSRSKPKPDDLLIYDSSLFNRYGHVAIVSSVLDTDAEIVQQNPGPFGSSRKRLVIRHEGEVWRYEDKRILGWLRKK